MATIDLSAVGQPKDALDTPALIVDLDAMDRNVARMMATFRQAGVGWRPHTKGLKVPALAQRLLAAGALGVTCAKLSEAEVMAAAGIRDILIANMVIGEGKVRRAAALCAYADPIVAVDSLDGARQLNDAAGAIGTRPRVVLEVDVGLGRCGVLPGEPVVDLAQRLAALPHIRFAGVMAWEGHTGRLPDPEEKRAAVTEAVGRLTASADRCRAAGLAVDIVSCGGTATYAITAHLPGVTEIQAGGGVLGDPNYRDACRVPHEYALTVLTTVVSRPHPQRVITDAGFKALGNPQFPPQPLGLPAGLVQSAGMSAEHGQLRLSAPDTRIRVGDRLELVPGYADSVVYLHDALYAVRENLVQAAWDISGRGKLQ
jgi:D-serine deaminase-like pyridoxal phosphate-dependent protein